MDAADLKTCVFSLLFFKCLSDAMLLSAAAYLQRHGQEWRYMCHSCILGLGPNLFYNIE
jgi:hypothetical protein